MKIDFNKLRRVLIQDYNALVEKAANVDHMSEEAYDTIRPHLDDLRKSIVILACLYDESAGVVSLADQKILVAP